MTTKKIECPQRMSDRKKEIKKERKDSLREISDAMGVLGTWVSSDELLSVAMERERKEKE